MGSLAHLMPIRLAFQRVLAHQVSRDFRTLLFRWPPSGQDAPVCSRCPDQLACLVRAQASVNVADTRGVLLGALASLGLAGDKGQSGKAETVERAPREHREGRGATWRLCAPPPQTPLLSLAPGPTPPEEVGLGSATGAQLSRAGKGALGAMGIL